MANNYFTQENSFRHQFFIRGLTADSFYPDGGMRLSIEWLTFLELRKSGYERIVFLDKNNMLYVYDDASLSLMHGRPQQSTLTAQNLGKAGLDIWDEEEDDTPVEDKPTDSKVYADGKYERTDNENIGILHMDESPLHLGRMAYEDAWEQIDSYMHDRTIKTAIVIRDADSTFHNGQRQASRLEQAFEHELTVGYQRLDDENENIMVLISGDSNLGTICNHKDLDFENKNVNIIEIKCPNALELKNMLLYFRTKNGLKLSMHELDEVSLALHQAMALRTPQVRVKELYKYLSRYSKTNRVLHPEDCYKLLDVKKPQSAKQQLHTLIGMENVKKKLESYDIGAINHSNQFLGLSASRLQPDEKRKNPVRKEQMIHFVLTGNPGTGKTTTAKMIGQLFYEMGYLADGHVVETDRSQLVAEYVGHTAIKTRNKVLEALGGVLFVDEAYALVRDENHKSDFGQEAVDTLVKCMDEFKGQFILVAAGYDAPMQTFLESNPGLSSRFGNNHIHIDDYTANEMNQILHLKAKNAGFVFSDEFEKKLPDFCENWVNQADENWGNGREAETLINDMEKLWYRDDTHTTITKDDHTLGVLSLRHLPEEMNALLIPISESREAVLQKLEKMTGLAGVKERIMTIRNGLAVNKDFYMRPIHYRFEGNPGTGKTTVARYMGEILRNLGMLKRGRLVEYTATSLMQEMTQKHKSFEEIASKALGDVLFIDEAYQLVNYDVGKTILDSLLPYMENHAGEICVILAGYPDDMESLIAYNDGFQSRFDRPIVFDNYSAEELHQIMLMMLKNKGYAVDDDFVENAKRILHTYIPRIARDKGFGNARYMRNEFIPDCIDVQARRLINTYGEGNIPEEERRLLRGSDFPDNLLGFAKTAVKKKEHKSALEKMNELIGFDSVKQELQKLINLKHKADETNHPELMDAQNIHWVLKGNPGTGKTTVANLIGQVYRELDILPKGHVVKATRQDIVGQYIGHTEHNMQKLIDQAMGGVLFIDEAYTLTSGNRDTNDFGQKAIDVLLEQMSVRVGEFAVIVAGYPNEMDLFVRSNPGLKSRFSKDFILENYTAEQTAQIFALKCRENEFVLEDGLQEKLVTVFQTMIDRKGKEWANGREAENLFNAMKLQWASSEDTESVFKESHIPEEYLNQKNSQDELEQTVFAPNANDYMYPIANSRLCKQYPAFDFSHREYLKQTNALVFIVNTTKEGTAFGSGAIITTDGCILTCYHVVDGAKQLKVRLRTTEFGIEKSVWKDGMVVWYDAEMDVAIIKMEDGIYPTLPLQPIDAEVEDGEEIYHWGYPFGRSLNDDLDALNPSFFKGSVSSRQTKKSAERIYINMEAKSGSSGGPVFSQEHGYIVGILRGSDTHSNGKLIEELNFIVPMSEIWSVIGEFDGGLEDV